MANNFKNMLKFVMLKSCKTFHLIKKLFSNLFSNPRGDSLALQAEKFKKLQKISKKREKSKFYQNIAKICDIKKLKNYSSH